MKKSIKLLFFIQIAFLGYISAQNTISGTIKMVNNNVINGVTVKLLDADQHLLATFVPIEGVFEISNEI